MSIERGLVEVDHHQFTISNAGTDDTAATQHGSLFDTGPGFVRVHTGVATGPVDVTIEILSEFPEVAGLGEWDNVEDGWLTSTSELALINTNGNIADGFESLARMSGLPHGIRVHSLGRAVNWDAIVDAPAERYLVQLWPSAQLVSLYERKATDGVWVDTSESAAFSAPTDDLGADATVRLRGPVKAPLD